MDDRWWHQSCLRCSVCPDSLAEQTSCFVMHGQIYCETHIKEKLKAEQTKCAKCGQVISRQDLVYPAKDLVFHVPCFVCCICDRQFCKGDRYTLNANQPQCFIHNEESIDDGMMSIENGGDGHARDNKKRKRTHTTYTENQRAILLRHFYKEPNPNRKMLQQIANEVQVGKDKVRIWFYNASTRYQSYGTVYKYGQPGTFPIVSSAVPRVQEVSSGWRSALNNISNNSYSYDNLRGAGGSRHWFF